MFLPAIGIRLLASALPSRWGGPRHDLDTRGKGRGAPNQDQINLMLAFPPMQADDPSRHRDPRTQRIAHTHQRMLFALRDLVYSNPMTLGLGPDPLVMQLMSAEGFKALDYVAMSITVRGKAATALVVPTRIWRDPDARALVLAVKEQAAALRTRVLLVPQRSITSTMRADVAKTIGRSRGVRFVASHVDAVMAHVKHARLTTIAECCSFIDHEDPVGVVLAMAARGLVDLDRSRPVAASTFVSTTL